MYRLVSGSSHLGRARVNMWSTLSERLPAMCQISRARFLPNSCHGAEDIGRVRNLWIQSSRPHQQNAKSSNLSPAIYVTASMIGFGLYSHQQARKSLNDAPTTPPDSSDQPLESIYAAILGRAKAPPMELDAAVAKLKSQEASTNHVTKRETDATRCDSVRVPSNDPVEDEKSYHSFSVGEAEEWKFWGVYDGHAGWEASLCLEQLLARYVVGALHEARVDAKLPSPEVIDRAIKTGFLKLDDTMLSNALKAMSDAIPHEKALSRVDAARAGSCALLAIFDPVNALLRVACTGDSRAILGRRTINSSENTTQEQPEYTVEVLSKDQTGFDEEEYQRIMDAHPEEPDIIDKKSGRLLGFAITRAFGDARLKWPIEAVEKCKSDFSGPSVRPHYKTPPYMTAEPEVTTTKIAPGDFLILASDGLWDHFSNEDAVECVRRWITKQRTGQSSSSGGTLQPLSEVSGDINLRSNLTYYYKSTPEHFVVEDDNVATHLVRNTLGGSRTMLFRRLLGTEAPDSRNVRDDITVQVVFFGDVLGTSSKK